MPQLVILTGPIAAGKNTVADNLARHLIQQGRTVVVADVDDVATMVRAPGDHSAGLAAGRAGLWFAAHEAHGAVVGQWMRSKVDVVIVVGPIYSAEEQAVLLRTVPGGAAVRWVVIDADVSTTLARAQADPTRGLSRQPEFHHSAHRRFRELAPLIPADRRFNSDDLDAEQIADAIAGMLSVG
jgi:hypothetical protein